MAPSARGRRQAGTVTRSKVVPGTDGDPAPPRSARIHGNDTRESRNANQKLDDASNAQDYRPWSSEPEPYDEKAYTAWGRKHYGDDWYEQRELMFQERNFLKPSVNDDHVYLERQKALREMELEREQGNLLLDKGKTWQELKAWARMHYGKVWYAQRQALERDEQEQQEAVDPDESNKKGRKAYKRWKLVREMQWATDEDMLAQGKTWQEIMAWPPDPSNDMPSVETGDGVDADAVRSPSTSSDDNSMISTYPPTPTDFRREAKSGPQPIYPDKGRSSDAKWEAAMGSANWEGLEWRAVARHLSEAQYEERKVARVAGIRAQRSLREIEAGDLRNLGELTEIRYSDLSKRVRKEDERKRRMRDIDLRQKGWTQDDIDTLDREEAAAAQKRSEEWHKREGLGPKNQEEMDFQFRTWDMLGVSWERQNELARMYGFGPRQASSDGHAESGVALQSQTSPNRPAKDTSRTTRGGRIKKNVLQRQSGSRRGTQSRQSAPTHAEVLPSDRRRSPSRHEVFKKFYDDTRTAPRRRRRQPTTYEKERASRRLAGQSPEFGMLQGRGEPPPSFEASLRQPSNAGKTSSPGPRSGRLSKKPTAVNGAKPQGISKSKQGRTSRPRGQ